MSNVIGIQLYVNSFHTEIFLYTLYISYQTMIF